MAWEAVGLGDHENLATEFAPAKRASQVVVDNQARSVGQTTMLVRVLDTVPDIVLVLNAERQIVYANESCVEFLALTDAECLHGLRPGEALHCVHASITEGGCGTTEFCRTCGAVGAVLASQEGRQVARECRITLAPDGDALDLLVWATPFELQGDKYTVLAVSDISHEKRRQALERVFFHDILNDAGGLQGLLDMLREAESAREIEQYREMLYQLSCKLVEEIKSQRTLTLAENGDLELEPNSVTSGELLSDMAVTYRNHPAAEGRTIILDDAAEDVPLVTDDALARRVLGNMTKNALEASHKDDTVTLGCRRLPDGVEFFVHNPTFMPREIQLQVFQRSFSTKGIGRGLGTYGMKLLGEKYLGGSIRFESSPEDGTTFFAQLPLTPPT